jgi:uncharacterized membrane protein YgdD (TMEM256/DUF423 family)
MTTPFLNIFAGMYRTMLCFAAISGCLVVLLGAMGAHLLRDHYHLPELNLQIYETAVRYQAYHSLALIGLSLFVMHHPSEQGNWSGRFFMSGILIFSGSLYFLALRPLFGIADDQLKWVGIFTPLGGLAFISGWFCLFLFALKLKK